MAVPPAKMTIGVMGGGSNEEKDIAEPLGRLLAKRNVNVLTGGGGGVMTSVSRAFVTTPTRKFGICIGVIPCLDEEHRETPKVGYPNEFIELPIYTHLPYSGTKGKDDLSRNHINILSSDVIIALPGGSGTLSEIELALQYKKPTVAFARNEDEIAHYPKNVHRVYNVKDLELFLNEIIT